MNLHAIDAVNRGNLHAIEQPSPGRRLLGVRFPHWCGQPTGHENEGWKGRGFASKHKASCRPAGAWNTPLITLARACLGVVATPLARAETLSKLDDDVVSRTGCITLCGNTFSISS